MANNKVAGYALERVQKLIEAGNLPPWRMPWRRSPQFEPVGNGGRPYHGWNSLNLGWVQRALGYKSNRWVTFKGAKELGGEVKKGARSEMVIYWGFVDRKDPKAQEGETSSKDKRIPFMRYYSVFNLDQCDGIEIEAPAPIQRPDMAPLAKAESIIDGWADKPRIETRDRAFYRPSEHMIGIPDFLDFESPSSYYHTIFHELVHSTSAPQYGVREMHKSYAREELVAEMGAMILLGECGLIPDCESQAAAYLDSWLGSSDCKADPYSLIWAAGQAEKAADLILGCAGEAEVIEDEEAA